MSEPEPIRINLARLVPIVVIIGWIALSIMANRAPDEGTSDGGYSYSSDYRPAWCDDEESGDPGDDYDSEFGYGSEVDLSTSSLCDTPDAVTTQDADAYLTEVATHLARPGLWVDPASIGRGGLDDADVATLAEQAATLPGPVRIAVVPAAKVRPDDQPAGIAYDDPMELLSQIYDRVGADGTYALLVDADSSESGRSFTAFQRSVSGPTYDIDDAVDKAVDRYAPDYAAMLQEFESQADDRTGRGWVILGWIALALAVVVGGWLGIRALARRHNRRRADREVAELLRPALTEEVTELELKVSALPPYAGDPTAPIAAATARVLDLVEQARQRLDDPTRMDTPEEAEQVTERLADARYQLAVIAALQAGRPAPRHNDPCFFDPRHGPSTQTRPFAPEAGAQRQVPVCDSCAATLDADQYPAYRQLPAPGGRLQVYWQSDRLSRPYVNGYWREHAFPVQRMERIRRTPTPLVSVPSAPRRRAVSFVWEGSGGSGRGGGFSGSRSSGGRRSFGGGSSHRSSSRSGHSRSF